MSLCDLEANLVFKASSGQPGLLHTETLSQKTVTKMPGIFVLEGESQPPKVFLSCPPWHT